MKNGYADEKEQMKRVIKIVEKFNLLQKNQIPIRDNTLDLLFTNDIAVINDNEVIKTSILGHNITGNTMLFLSSLQESILLLINIRKNVFSLIIHCVLNRLFYRFHLFIIAETSIIIQNQQSDHSITAPNIIWC